MKKPFSLIILLVMICNLQSCAVVTTESKPVTSVINLDPLKKNELYVKANNWMVEAFNNAESVIQFTDKESGTITGKYLLGVITNASQYGASNKAFAIIKIQVKDGASKITITPDSFSYAKGNIYTLYTEEKAVEDVNALISSFESYMKTKDSSDW